jgi:hypothetical protein
MNTEIKKLPPFLTLMDSTKINISFLEKIIDICNTTNETDELRKKISLLFSIKINEPRLFYWNYGWTTNEIKINNGLEISYKDELILFVPCNIDFINEDDDI